TMEIAEVGNPTDDGFTVELEHETQNTVRGGVLRTDVDEHVLTFQIRLDARRRLEGDRRSTIVSHQRDALRPSLRVETRCRELYFDGTLGHLLARPLALAQSVPHVLREVHKGVGDRELFHRVAILRILS